MKAKIRKIKDEISMVNRYLALYDPSSLSPPAHYDSAFLDDPSEELERLERQSKLVRKL